MSGSPSSARAAPATAAFLSLAAFLWLAAVPATADTFSFSGDTTTMNLAEGSQRALLTGHGRVESQDLRITADSIELFGKDFTYAQAKGNVHVVDAHRGLDLTSQELFYDREHKIARIRGNAALADLKNEMVVKGGFIEDRDKEQIDIIQIGVRIFHKDIVCRSEFARYQRDKKILELSGMPWVSKGGDVYQAARITVNLDTEEISLEGSVQGTLQDKGTTSDTGSAAGRDNGAVSGNGPTAPPSGSPQPASPPGAAPPTSPGPSSPTPLGPGTLPPPSGSTPPTTSPPAAPAKPAAPSPGPEGTGSGS